MSASPDTPRAAPRNETRRWLLTLLGVQCLFAIILFGSDLARVMPGLLSPSPAPALTEPVRPGDQTRRFSPGRIAPREMSPGGVPLPATGDMPSRLLLQPTRWKDAEATLLTGQIAPGDAARIGEEIARMAAPPEVILLHSPGGSVSDALALGRKLREAGIATAMQSGDVCLSACPYLLASGVSRVVEDGAMVGVHQHYFGENVALPAFLAVEDIQRGQGEVMGYLIEMGVDPALMRLALLTPPDEIYVLLPEELVEFDMVTSGETGLARPLARP